MNTNKVDRLSIRARPPGLSIMRQNWGKLLFMHWPVRADLLRPLIPGRLIVDTFEDHAWIGVVPFTMWGIRASFMPPIPGLSAFHELNVRTYVHLDGVPGVWFFSLDANSRLAVKGARAFYHLPYFNARINLEERGSTIDYDARREHRNAPPAEFSASWCYGESLPQAEPGSLAFFLTERYALYAAHKDRLYRSRIFHRSWPLQRAELLSYRSSMIRAQGLAEPDGAPLLYYADAVQVDIWPLARV